jgi:hypothetical protein
VTAQCSQLASTQFPRCTECVCVVELESVEVISRTDCVGEMLLCRAGQGSLLAQVVARSIDPLESRDVDVTYPGMRGR